MKLLEKLLRSWKLKGLGKPLQAKDLVEKEYDKDNVAIIRENYAKELPNKGIVIPKKRINKYKDFVDLEAALFVWKHLNLRDDGK